MPSDDAPATSSSEAGEDLVVWGDLELTGGSGGATISTGAFQLDDEPDEVTLGIGIDDHHLHLSLPPAAARDLGEELIELADACDDGRGQGVTLEGP